MLKLAAAQATCSLLHKSSAWASPLLRPASRTCIEEGQLPQPRDDGVRVKADPWRKHRRIRLERHLQHSRNTAHISTARTLRRAHSHRLGMLLISGDTSITEGPGATSGQMKCRRRSKVQQSYPVSMIRIDWIASCPAQVLSMHASSLLLALVPLRWASAGAGCWLKLLVGLPRLKLWLYSTPPRSTCRPAAAQPEVLCAGYTGCGEQLMAGTTQHAAHAMTPAWSEQKRILRHAI
jgi:hypothetical protein